MNRKIFAPIIIGILIVCYFAYLIFVYINFLPREYIIIPTIVLIALMSLTIYVVKERIDEIESGEEDDLSKY